jgi:probable HAF family extracellular repeat protein
MRPLRLLLALIALVLLGACRDASETLVGPAPDAALLATLVPPGGARGAVLDMNDAGVAVGWSLDATYATRAFRWERTGRLQSLGTLGGDWSEARFINAAGQVAGTSRTADGKMHVFLWTAAGGIRDLGTLGGGSIVLNGLSDSGLVVGWGTQSNGSTAGFAARDGAPLQILAGYPTDVNGAGVVVGRTGLGASTPFRWTESGGMEPLPAPWGSASWGSPRINDAGMIAGVASTGGASAAIRVLRWRPSGGYQELDRCGGSGCLDVPLAVNGHGTVAWIHGNDVMAWDPDGTVRSARTLIVSSSIVLSPDGKVAGTGSGRAFLWRRSVGVGYYRASSAITAINNGGEVAGYATVGEKPQPARFEAPDQHPPVANAGGPYEVLAGEALDLDAGLSSDPDGDPLRAYWGGFVPPCRWTSCRPAPSSPTVTYRWTVPGEYTVNLTVMDADSFFSSASAQVRVLPNPGGSTRLGPYTAAAGQLIRFDGRRPDDPAGSRYSYQWSFYKAPPGAVLDKKYNTQGTYDLSLTVRTGEGALVEVVHTRAVISLPTVEFVAPDVVSEGRPFLLGYEGYRLTNHATWQVSFDCGDGVWTPWRASSPGARETCPALLVGTHTIRGRLRDGAAGPVTEHSRQLTIQNRPPQNVYLSPSGGARAGASTAVEVAFGDTPPGPWIVYVNWGDGVVTQTTTPSMDPVTLSHVYAAAGNYGAHAFVRDAHGGGGRSATRTITVAP